MKRFLPATLFGRLMLILVAGLLAAQALTFLLIWAERTRSSQSMMLGYFARDAAAAVAILERLPAQERSAWLDTLARRNYRYVLPGTLAEAEPATDTAELAAAQLSAAVGPAYDIKAATGADGQPWLQLQLKDGTPLAIVLNPGTIPMATWLPVLLCAQLVLIAAACWLAVQLATRPLKDLAKAAESLTPEHTAVRVAEDGPEEVSKAARSFNAMHDRIARHMQERSHILAAISHDLQTPITRMRLRTELMDDPDERSRWQGDLDAMQGLVREGIAYARSAHAAAEPAQRIDCDALLDAMLADYVESGADVHGTGKAGRPIVTKPQALRRIVGNLIDNALKYAGAAEIDIAIRDNRLSISVLDRGPGIPESELDAVMQPFYRLERSRGRDTGGSGLGLAIAQQLARAIDGEIVLANRIGGGLIATLTIKIG